eukprot:GEMP01080457.1.p2 GENE.GEMP01080457.1~~GEMP01080457.1.p2  ORF type:complete len:230 (+),score=27.75 GEMP01080457.1:246-935(+)
MEQQLFLQQIFVLDPARRTLASLLRPATRQELQLVQQLRQPASVLQVPMSWLTVPQQVQQQLFALDQVRRTLASLPRHATWPELSRLPRPHQTVSVLRAPKSSPIARQQVQQQLFVLHPGRQILASLRRRATRLELPPRLRLRQPVSVLQPPVSSQTVIQPTAPKFALALVLVTYAPLAQYAPLPEPMKSQRVLRRLWVLPVEIPQALRLHASRTMHAIRQLTPIVVAL